MRCEETALEMFKDNLSSLFKGNKKSTLSIDPHQRLRYLRDRPSMNIAEYNGDSHAFYLAWSYLGDEGPYVLISGRKYAISLIN